MLYHPCANALEVNQLKKLVKGCLRRHIISPNNFLDEKRVSYINTKINDELQILIAKNLCILSV